MEDELYIHGDEYVLTATRLKGAYTLLISIHDDDGSANATMSKEEAVMLASWILEPFKND